MGRSSANLMDISFAGATIELGGVTVSSFMDDANPLDVQDVETTNVEWSCNGRMIRTVKPSGILISVTVVPGSVSDIALRRILMQNFSNGGNIGLDATNKLLTGNITLRNSYMGKKSFSFANGTLLSGPFAPSAQGNGKLGGNTYTFMFEKYV